MNSLQRTAILATLACVSAACSELPSVEDSSPGTDSGGDAAGSTDSAPAPDVGTLPPPPPPGGERDRLAVYMTGHSLINLQMPGFVAEIARGHGKTHEYNLQMGIGSNMSWRLSGEGAEQDRDGNPLTYDALDEIAQANTVTVGAYDALVITEAVELRNHVFFSGTIPNTVVYARALRDDHPAGDVFLYDSWDSVETSGGSPALWVERTRRQFNFWRCVAAKASEDPALSGRRIRMVSGGQILAAVVNAALNGELEGVSASDLLRDDGHHPTALGNYAVALGMYSLLYGASPQGSSTSYATESLTVPEARARAIENVVWAEVQRLRTVTDTPPSGCASLAAEAACPAGDSACAAQMRETFP